MSHDHHESLPGYDPGQVLVDGCGECESRSKTSTHGLLSLDPQRFRAAWDRAARWHAYGLHTMSDAELPLLTVLAAVQVQGAVLR